MTNLRTYKELIRLRTFEERYSYLQLFGDVGHATFGFDRYMNQAFYTSVEWKQIRSHIIVRDHGCDLAMPDREIHGRVYIHHMNPISQVDIKESTEFLLNPEFLICTSHNTHNAIHYGNEDLLFTGLVERKPGDTTLW